MKRIFFTSALLLALGLGGVTRAASATWPDYMNYQGQLTDPSGIAVADGAYTVVFSIYGINSGGVAIWTESQVVNTQKGLFNAVLGSVTPMTVLSGYLHQYQDLWLGIKVGADAEMTPRQQLLPALNARFAINSSTLNGYSLGSGAFNIVQLDGSGKIPAGLVNGGSVSVPLDLVGSSSYILKVRENSGTPGNLGASIVGPSGLSVTAGAAGGYGIWGMSDSGMGMRASSISGLGMVAESGSYIGLSVTTQSVAYPALLAQGEKPAALITTGSGIALQATTLAGGQTVNLLDRGAKAGLLVASSGASTYGVSATAAGSVGVYGRSNANTDAGVWGENQSPSASAIGVRGDGYTGVRGISTSLNGYGVLGTNNTASGWGVYGLNSSNIGVRGDGLWGVQGESSAASGRGVSGRSTNASGFGTVGENTTATGVGVYGLHSSTGAGIGVLGASSGTGGRAVSGTATGASAIGVAGVATAGTGTGVYGFGGGDGGAFNGTNAGVRGNASGPSGAGVAGIGYDGVYGEGTNAVHGFVDGSGAKAVYAQVADPDSYGVYAYNSTDASLPTIYAYTNGSTAGTPAIDGYGPTGVQGRSYNFNTTTAGVIGSGYQQGVWGQATSGYGQNYYGVRGSGPYGVGVAGEGYYSGVSGVSTTLSSTRSLYSGVRGWGRYTGVAGFADYSNINATGVYGEGIYNGGYFSASYTASASAIGVKAYGYYGVRAYGYPGGASFDADSSSNPTTGFRFYDSAGNAGSTGFYGYNYCSACKVAFFSNVSSTAYDSTGYALFTEGKIITKGMAGYVYFSATSSYTLNNPNITSSSAIQLTPRFNTTANFYTDFPTNGSVVLRSSAAVTGYVQYTITNY